MDQKKVGTDGEKEMKEAEKHMKTGILKWTADYDMAAMSYTKAATSFKNAKDYAKYMDCSIKAGECHLKNKAIFQAAKSFEQGAFAAKEVGDYQKLSDLINRAYLLQIENGTSDTAANLLDRGGKMLEENLPEQAVALYKKAADLAQIQDKPGTASEMFERAARALIKMEKFSDASKVLEELLQHELMTPTPAGRRYVLLLVLVHLKREDFVAARLACEQGSTLPDNGGTGELSMARTLLDAYDNYDRQAFKAAATGPFLRQLDPAYARLARVLDIPDTEELPSVTPKAQPIITTDSPIPATPPKEGDSTSSPSSPHATPEASTDLSGQEMSRGAVPDEDDDDLT